MINNNNTLKKKCFECNKKLSISSGIQCRCLQYFCGLHRYPENHDCSFDYKFFEKEQLSKNIIKCIPTKIEQL